MLAHPTLREHAQPDFRKCRCDALKLAMIKNAHLADRLFGGQVYDCVCLFEPATVSLPSQDSK